MGLSKASSLPAVRTAAATVALAVVLMGPTACGSDESSDSAKSPTQPTREAGAFSMDTRLQVINQDPAGLKITICGNGQCKAAKDLQVGESDDMAAEDVNGWVRFADGYQVDFAAGNPDIGRPWIELKGPPSNGAGDGDTTRLGLDVGGVQETAEDQFAGYPFVGSRGPDTDYKMLTLKVYAWGGGAGGAGGGGSGAGGEEEEE